MKGVTSPNTLGNKYTANLHAPYVSEFAIIVSCRQNLGCGVSVGTAERRQHVAAIGWKATRKAEI